MTTVRDQGHPETTQAIPMSKARDLINAHLYPVLAAFAVIYGAIQIAPIAQQARDMNACVQQGLKAHPKAVKEDRGSARAITVSVCNGGDTIWKLR